MTFLLNSFCPSCPDHRGVTYVTTDLSPTVYPLWWSVPAGADGPHGHDGSSLVLHHVSGASVHTQYRLLPAAA